MTSVERIREYGCLEQEAAEHNDYPLHPDWPTHGAIVFDHVTLTYQHGESFVDALSDVSFSIDPGQKVY